MFNVLLVAILCAAVAALLRFARTKSKVGLKARALYERLVVVSRKPAFYSTLAVPDTMEGRFGVLVIHLTAVVERLTRAGEHGGRLARSLVETFVDDMEDTMREAGIGDTSVPRKVKKAAIAFYDRREQYHEALLAGDEPRLAALVADHLTRDAAAACGAPLARYLAATVAELERQTDEAVLGGNLTFPSLAPSPTDGAAQPDAGGLP